MGYCMSQQNADFFIAAEDKDKALAALKKLGDNTDNMRGGSWSGGGKQQSWYSWVDMEFVNRYDLESAVRDWRWDLYCDDDGNVVEIMFEGEKLGQDEILFEALAPWVKSGSYIEMHGEDGSLWRWCFDDGKFKEKAANISWE